VSIGFIDQISYFPSLQPSNLTALREIFLKGFRNCINVFNTWFVNSLKWLNTGLEKLK